MNKQASASFRRAASFSEGTSTKTSKLDVQLYSSWVLNAGLLVARDDLLTQVVDNFKRRPLQIIEGHKATGKTTLALCYATQCKEKYTWMRWIDAKAFESDLLELADFARIGEGKIPERLSRLRAWLGREERWLLIIDNVDPEDCAKIKEWIPLDRKSTRLNSSH